MSDDDTIAALPSSATGDGASSGASGLNDSDAEEEDDEADIADDGMDEDGADADALMRSVAGASADEIGEARPAKKRKKEKADAQQEDDRPFVPFKKFAGAKKGYRFQAGDSGVGYYKDVLPIVAVKSGGGKGKGKKFKKGPGTSRGQKKRDRQELKKKMKEEMKEGGGKNRATRGGRL